ncbi:hypothetical protein BN874_590010 [Candidatus Contendobacter odensis Run_B_J11]|uniref:Uncharacterized protein n=1 Tax=Candidatus Contendobacter odensis Run_B_J11 TaxID=1400861 RepID=A0A7U7J5S3_9GAMM|nr:hypothetical protein BN874_590010 [Candidatus Contendobacter odensis Run_B_J11]
MFTSFGTLSSNPHGGGFCPRSVAYPPLVVSDRVAYTQPFYQTFKLRKPFLFKANRLAAIIALWFLMNPTLTMGALYGPCLISQAP